MDEMRDNSANPVAVGNASRLFCVDMTQLISADSCLPSLHREPGQLRRIADPEAASSFVTVATILTNPRAQLYFKRPDGFDNIKPTALMGLWAKFAKNQEIPYGQGLLLRDPRPRLEYESIGKAFDEYLSEPGVPAKLARWARFQLTDPDLFTTYAWANTVEHSSGPLSSLEKSRPANLKLLQSAIAERRFPLCGGAKSYSGNEPDRFKLAYIFWAFCKGFTYAAELPGKNGYAVHWLRERAMRVDSSPSVILPGHEGEFGLFPWGEAVFQLAQELPAGRVEDLSRCLSRLRTYSKTALGSLWDEIGEVRENLDPERSPTPDLLFEKPVEAVCRRTYDTLEKGLIHALPPGVTADRAIMALITLLWVGHFAVPGWRGTAFATKLVRRIPPAWLEDHVINPVHHTVTVLRYGRRITRARSSQPVRAAVERFLEAQIMT